MSELVTKILTDSSSALLGASFFTFLLFALNEWIIPKKNVSGEWVVYETVEDSTRIDLKGYILKYKFHLLQKGYEIEGSGEKISETPPNEKEFFYDADKRVTVTFSGYMERKFLTKSKIYFHIVEIGRKREFRTSFVVEIKDSNILFGRLISTAANSKGVVKFQKDY